jgi:hypothetical protein
MTKDSIPAPDLDSRMLLRHLDIPSLRRGDFVGVLGDHNYYFDGVNGVIDEIQLAQMKQLDAHVAMERAHQHAMQNQPSQQDLHAWDKQVGGDHYKKMAIQPMEYGMKNHLDPLQFTIVKYVSRFRDKGGIKDLEKARHCIDMLIEHEKTQAEYREKEHASQAQQQAVNSGGNATGSAQVDGTTVAHREGGGGCSYPTQYAGTCRDTPVQCINSGGGAGRPDHFKG